MVLGMAINLKVSAKDQIELESTLRCRSLPAEDVRRADIILRLAEGQPQRTVAQQLRCSINTVRLWRERYAAEGLGGLYARHQGRQVKAESPALEARILDWTRRLPQDGSTHWSTRKLAGELGISHMRVARTWAKAGLQPHRLRGYMTSDDPQFHKKATDVIGLYLKPPTNAVVFCVDEKTAIQALDRLDPVLPLSAGRAERHGFEYFRHGTLSLYAALNTQTGQVLGKTASRHTSAEFVAFLTQLASGQPKRRELHVIVDNLSAHKTEKVELFLRAHPRVKLHFTPTYSSWLNQVELWFSKIERDVIARGVFSSVKDLAKKLMRYIRHYNRQAKPVKWTYKNTRNRIRPESDLNVTVHYLVAPNGTLVVLLNRPGVTTGNPFGYAGSGLNVTLSDAASGSIQTTAEAAGTAFTGTYQAAGSLASFNGGAADGTWALYFADESAGGGQATLSGWSLDITAVPEPVNVALVIFAAGVLGGGGITAI